MRKRVNLGTCEWQVGGVAWASTVEEVLEPPTPDASGQLRGEGNARSAAEEVRDEGAVRSRRSRDVQHEDEAASTAR